MICALYSHTYGGFSQTKVWKPFNVCMKEPANSSTVVTRQYLQVYTDGRLKINMNTFRIYCCSLFGSTAGVKSANLWCSLHTPHLLPLWYMTFSTVGKVQGDEESQSPWCALYLLWNVTAYRNTLRVHPFTVHSCVHSQHTFIDPASMTRCWSDDHQAGWENKPNGQMWTGCSCFWHSSLKSQIICVSHQTTTSDVFLLSYTTCLKKSRLHQRLLL